MLQRRHLLRLMSLVPLALTSRATLAAILPSPKEGLSLSTESAQRIGRIYLQEYPAHAQAEAIRKLPSEKVALQRLVEQDFTQGDIVILKGWVLSRTECQICARAFLEQGAADVR